jgi:MFS family permease
VVIFSQDLKWLIAARALSGVGGGGIVSSVWVITAEIVEVPKRAKWSQALSVTWSCSAIAGPVLGGIFSGCKSRFRDLISVLMGLVSGGFFRFELEMVLYVMTPFRFGK